MTNQEPQKNPGFDIFHSSGEKTPEYAKIALVTSFAEGLLAIWDTEQAYSNDFKKVIMDALNAAYQAPNPEMLSKLGKLKEKLGATASAASKPVEERTTQEQQIVADELAAADVDGDGVVSAEEARQRVFTIFKEMGLDEQAQWFLDKRQVRQRS